MSEAVLSVIVPAYNEVGTVREAVERIHAAGLSVTLEVIGVDDGSTDGTLDVLRQLEAEGRCARVFSLPARTGKGAAVRHGIAESSGDFVVVHDADLEYDPRDLAAMLHLLQEAKADAVCGTRFGSSGRSVLFYWRSLANRSLTLMSNAFSNLNLSDVNCCYKMIRGDVVRALGLSSSGFTIEVELVARLAARRVRVWETPVTYAGRRNPDGRKTRWWHAVEQACAIPLFYTRAKRA